LTHRILKQWTLQITLMDGTITPLKLTTRFTLTRKNIKKNKNEKKHGIIIKNRNFKMFVTYEFDGTCKELPPIVIWSMSGFEKTDTMTARTPYLHSLKKV